MLHGGKKKKQYLSPSPFITLQVSDGGSVCTIGDLRFRVICASFLLLLSSFTPPPTLTFCPADTGHELWFNGAGTGEGSAKPFFFFHHTKQSKGSLMGPFEESQMCRSPFIRCNYTSTDISSTCTDVL